MVQASQRSAPFLSANKDEQVRIFPSQDTKICSALKHTQRHDGQTFHSLAVIKCTHLSEQRVEVLNSITDIYRHANLLF